MGKKVIRLTENDLTNIVKRVINEQNDNYNYQMAIQCFLNQKGIRDDQNKPLKMDGSIGRLPNSKSAQAISKYQTRIGVDSDGVWGRLTLEKMPPADKVMFKKCASKHGDIFDKILHFFNLD